MEYSDKELARLIANGSEEAFGELVRLYGGLIKAIVYRHLYNMPAWQEDCINDILLKLWQNIKSYDPEKSSLKSWGAAVARYRCIDFKRKYLRELGEQLDESYPDRQANISLLKHETEEEIASLLSGLSPEDRKIFIRRYFRDETIEEIASSSGMSPSRIYNRLSRSRKKLRKLFVKERQ